jgi:hypothetical protein
VGVIDALKVASEVLHHGFKRLDFPSTPTSDIT